MIVQYIEKTSDYDGPVIAIQYQTSEEAFDMGRMVQKLSDNGTTYWVGRTGAIIIPLSVATEIGMVSVPWSVQKGMANYQLLMTTAIQEKLKRLNKNSHRNNSKQISWQEARDRIQCNLDELNSLDELDHDEEMIEAAADIGNYADMIISLLKGKSYL